MHWNRWCTFICISYIAWRTQALSICLQIYPSKRLSVWQATATRILNHGMVKYQIHLLLDACKMRKYPDKIVIKHFRKHQMYRHGNTMPECGVHVCICAFRISQIHYAQCLHIDSPLFAHVHSDRVYLNRSMNARLFVCVCVYAWATWMNYV